MGASTDSTKPFRSLLIFGPPGAGKGTVSQAITQAFPLIHISTGEIFRNLDPHSPSGQLIASYSSKGNYVPDEVVIDVFTDHVHGMVDQGAYNPVDQLLLLDGIPRTQEQAEHLDKNFDVVAVIFLVVNDEDVLVRRLKGRAEKEGRVDDMDEAVLRNRFAVYREKTAGILKHYPEACIVRIDANQSPKKVLQDVEAAIADKI